MLYKYRYRDLETLKNIIPIFRIYILFCRIYLYYNKVNTNVCVNEVLRYSKYMYILKPLIYVCM